MDRMVTEDEELIAIARSRENEVPVRYPLKGKINLNPTKSLAKLFAFGAGAFTAALVIGEAINLGLAISAKRLDR